MNDFESVSYHIERLPFHKRMIASAGGISACIDMLMIQTFLLYYYTDVIKINAAFAGGLLLVIRILSALAAPAFGIFIDRTSTPWGKYRPYYMILGIPTALFGFLTFTSFDLGITGRYLYASASYLIYSLLISLSAVPKGAMGPVMTKSIEDRVSMGFMGYLFSVIGSLLVVSGVPVFVRILGGTNEVQGFSLTMAMFATINIFISIIQWRFLEEKYANQNHVNAVRYPFLELVSSVLHNKTAMVVLTLTFSMNLANGLRMAVTMHYLKYHFHRPELMVQFGLLSMLCLFAGAFLSAYVTRCIGVKRVLIICTIFTIVSFAVVYPINNENSGVIIYLILSMTSNFFNGLSTPAQSTLMPHAIDYSEWKTGMNTGAFMSSMTTFVSTVATAISGIIVGAVLSANGYQPDVEQSRNSLAGIRFLMSIAPAIASLISLTAILLGNTEKEHKIIVKELMERRSSSCE